MISYAPYKQLRKFNRSTYVQYVFVIKTDRLKRFTKLSTLYIHEFHMSREETACLLTIIWRLVLLVTGCGVLIIDFDAVVMQNNQCLERGQTVRTV